MTQSIHQRVAELVESNLSMKSGAYSLAEFHDSRQKLIAAILAEEYGPLIEAAREIVLVSSSSVARRHIDAANALRAELSKKGLI